MRIIELMKEKQGVLIGMVHCLPLPGAMNHCGSMDAVVAKAVADAKKLEQAGFDAVLVEPTLDRPMGMTRGPLQLAAMSVICGAVHQVVSVPMGVSFMTADCGDLFAIARASGADFVRITAFVDTVRFPVGVVQPCAARVWEVRRNGGMEDIAVLADIQVKHAEMVFPQVTLEQSAYYAQAQGADAIVVTGDSTGQETPLETIQRARRGCIQYQKSDGTGGRLYCRLLHQARRGSVRRCGAGTGPGLGGGAKRLREGIHGTYIPIRPAGDRFAK